MFSRKLNPLRNIAILLLLFQNTDAMAQTIVLKADRMLDVDTGKIISPAALIIEGNRIKAVINPAAVPDSAETIDLGDMTLLPGLLADVIAVAGKSSNGRML